METVKIEFPIKTKGAYEESKAVSHMVYGLNKLLEIGGLRGKLDDIVLDYKIHNPGGYAIAIVDKAAVNDVSKFNTVGAGLSFPVDVIQDVVELKDRQFSAASIQERLRINGLQTRVKFRYTILDYKKFYASKKSTLESKPELMRRLKDMFVLDLMGIFNEVMPYIQEGKQLATLTGLQSITDGLNTSAKDLSYAYRRALKQAKNGQISPVVFKTLQAKYKEFMNLLIPQVFPGIEEILSQTNETRTQSQVTGTITVQTNNPDLIHSLLSCIRDNGDSGLKITVGDTSTYDWSAQDKIVSLQMSKVESNKSYVVGSDGLIKLYD